MLNGGKCMERLNKFTAWAMIIACVVYYLVGGSETLVAVVSAINLVITIFNIRNEFKNK